MRNSIYNKWSFFLFQVNKWRFILFFLLRERERCGGILILSLSVDFKTSVLIFMLEENRIMIVGGHFQR